MRTIIMAFATLLICIFSILFIVKQPLFFRQKNTGFDGKALSDKEMLAKHVMYLSRCNRTSVDGLKLVASYLVEELQKNGIDRQNIELQSYTVDVREYANVIAHIRSESPFEKVPKYLIGAHYDAYDALPGADDNASGMAGLLEIARVLSNTKELNNRDIDLVFYSTEEPPFFGTQSMGSCTHADSIRNDKNVRLLINLEMLGYFSLHEYSQHFPIPILSYMYPNKGNFIAIVSNLKNWGITRSLKKLFRTYLSRNSLITVESFNAPSFVSGVDFSDHRNYWKYGIPAVMITDTASNRHPGYHTAQDTYEKLDFEKMKEVVDAVIYSILSL